MKRILALLLCFCLCVSLIPAAFAEDTDEIIILDEDFFDDFDDDLDEDDLIDIVDPEAVQPPADELLGSLPASGTCGPNLTWDLTADGSLLISGTGEMNDYFETLAPWKQYESSSFHIQNISVGEGVTTIGMGAFAYLEHVSALSLPSSLQRIKDYSCIGLGISNLSLPSGLEEIGMHAFRDCDNIFSVTIPASVTRVGEGAFSGCSSLSIFSVPSSSACYKAVDNVLFSKDGKQLVSFPMGYGNTMAPGPAATYYEVPEGTLSIGPGAFRNNSALEVVNLPNSLTQIAYYGFLDCTALERIQIPDSVNNIEEQAFAGCTSLELAVMPNELEWIPWYCFRGCSNLTGFFFRDNPSLTTIAYGAFEGCGRLKSVFLPDTLETIQVCAFKDTGLRQVELPDSVSEVMTQAFMGCKDLEYVLFGTGLEKLGPWVVTQCDNLDRVYFKGDAPEFNIETFRSCELENVPEYPMVLEAFYPSDNSTWTSGVRKNYGGTITWKPYTNGLFIIDQPKDASAENGAWASFRVRVKCASEVVYQWQYKTADSLSGSWKNYGEAKLHDAALQFQATDEMDGSCYRCKMTSGGTTLISDTAWLSVGNSGAPVITTQPTSKTVKEGATAKFTVTATGATSYQWQYRRGDDGEWHNSSADSAKTKTLSIEATAARSGLQFRCKVSNASGTKISNIVTLTVATTPRITSQPTSKVAAKDSTAKFTVVASGVGLSYQWQYRKSETGTWYNSSSTGAKTATLSVGATEARNGFQFRCKITNIAGSVFTRAATLTVVTKPVVTTQPKDKTVAAGTQVKFYVQASGGRLSYQWQYRKGSSGTWYNSGSTGAQSSVLTVDATTARDGFQFRCKITNLAGTTYSSYGTLTVCTKPTITTQPTSKTVTAGTTVKFKVTATGNALKYQWQYRRGSDGEWHNSTADSAKTATLTIDATTARSGLQFRCKITNAAGTTYSNVVTLTVK